MKTLQFEELKSLKGGSTQPVAMNMGNGTAATGPGELCSSGTSAAGNSCFSYSSDYSIGNGLFGYNHCMPVDKPCN